MAGGPAVLKFSRGLPPTRQFGERLRLLVVQGQDKGTCYSILGDLVFIGREGCQIVLNDTNISRKHAEVGWKGDHFVVRDLGSANGVLHNGMKVTEAILKPGDLVLIGLTTLEVYPPGQTRRNDRPLLPAGSKRPPLPAAQAATSAANGGETKGDPKLSAEELKRKRDNEKKKLIVYVGLFFLAFILYFSEGENTTIRENAKLEPGEVETKGPKKKKQSQKEIREALAEYIPNYSKDTQQRKDAEIFFRTGVRELQNKNFRRAFTAFETALTVDPSHDLAKIYLKTAKKEMLTDIEAIFAAGIRAQKSLRFRESRMHFANILRYLEGEEGHSQYMDNESNKKVKKIFDDTQKAIKEMDEAEKKIQ